MPASRMGPSICAQLVHVGAHAGEVRHRLHAVVALEVAHDVDRLALLRRAAGRPVGHRHERRRQPRQLGEGAPEVALAFVRLGREELEREGRLAAGGQALVDPHGHGVYGRSGGTAAAARASAPCGGRPARGLVLDAPDPPEPVQVLEVAEHLREQPGVLPRRVLVAVDDRQEVVCGRLAVVAQRREDRREAPGDERAVGVDVTGQVGERTRVAGQGQPDVEPRDDVQRGEELSDRVGRPAMVEVERGAPRT